MPPEFFAAVRSMLLPITQRLEGDYVQYVWDHLDRLHVSDVDKASWIAVQLRRWRNGGVPTREFKELVKSSLFLDARTPKTFMFESLDGPSGPIFSEAATKAAKRYFEIHQSLISKHLFNHDAARQLLAHSGMIVRLGADELMTASEISRLVSIRDKRFELNWKAIQTIMQKLGCAPAISVANAEATFAEDSAAEAAMFGDLDIEGCIAKVARLATDIGCPGDFEQWLSDVIVRDVHDPYLLLLHYQLLAQAHYDHAVTYAYEFSPRGQVADWLTEKYVSVGIPVAKSAFLNNAKATLRFDKVWVTGRDDHLRAANALASILEQMENLGAGAKNELAAHIRGILHRHLRTKSEEAGGAIPHQIPDLVTGDIAQLLGGISASNTGTTGILEQRVVDCLGLYRHSAGDGWVSKGLGDSVFAANTFRKKFGDCEFELPERAGPQIVAYESHGGNLTKPYVEDHMDSFRQVLQSRKDELTVLRDLTDWSFTVVFVAHGLAAGLPAAMDIAVDGGVVTVQLEYMEFSDLERDLVGCPDLEQLFSDHFTTRLNSFFVHPAVRESTKRLAGI